jgi:hypothetical protein
MVENIGLRGSAVVISAMFVGLCFFPIIGVHLFYGRKRQQIVEDSTACRVMSGVAHHDTV